jgi:hypothetical protein
MAINNTLSLETNLLAPCVRLVDSPGAAARTWYSPYSRSTQVLANLETDDSLGTQLFGVFCALAHVKDRDAHAPEGRNPLVSLGLVVSEAAYVVGCHLVVSNCDNREHVGEPLPQPHSKLLQLHFHHHRLVWGEPLVVAQSELAVL